MKEEDVPTVQPFLKGLDVSELEKIKDDDDNIMTWEARQKETHELVRLLLKREEKTLKKNIEAKLSKHTDRENWLAPDWAVNRGKYVVVWWILQSGGTTEETNNLKTALRIAEII